MRIRPAFITYHRLDRAKLALRSVLADPKGQFSLAVWNNGSTNRASKCLRTKVCDHRAAEIVFSKDSLGQTAAVNEIWGRSEPDLPGERDGNCMVTPLWTRMLAKVRSDIEQSSALA